MTNDLETRIRASLSERAHDVEPTPELWRSVQRRTARQRFVPMAAWTAGLTAAAVTAFIVVPNVLDSTERSVSIEPLDGRAGEGVAPDAAEMSGAIPNLYVAAEDRDLVLRTVDRSQADRLLLSSVDGPILAVEVNPRSTADDLTVAFTVRMSDGSASIRIARLVDAVVVSDVVLATVPSVGEVAPQAVWSPDGTAVAWGEGALSGLPSSGALHIHGWDGRGLTSEIVSEAPAGFLPVGDLVVQDWNAGDRASQILAVAGGVAFEAVVPDGTERAVGAWNELSVDRFGDLLPRIIDVAVTPRVTWVVSRDDRTISITSLMADGSGIGAGWDGADRVTLTAFGDGALIGAGLHSSVAVIGPDERTGPWPWSGTSASSAMPSIPPADAVAFVPVPDGALSTSDDRWGVGFAGPADDADPELEPGTAPAGAEGAPYLAVDREGRLVLGTAEGRSVLVEVPADPEAEGSPAPMDVAVRPGSTPEDLTAVALYATEAGPEYRWVQVVDGDVRVERFPDEHQIGFDADLRILQVPVWSPDGRHLAWVERSADGDWRLRTVGWEDGPGTGRPTDDNASTTLPLTANDLFLADWVWTSSDGADGRAGELRFTVDREAFAAEPLALTYAIARQADGALSFSEELVAFREEGRQIIDLHSWDVGAVDLLTRASDGTVLVELSGGEVVAIDVPAATPGSSLDLDATPDGAIVTDRSTGRVLLVARDGGVTVVADADTGPLVALDRVD